MSLSVSSGWTKGSPRSELEDYDCENGHLPVDPEFMWDLWDHRVPAGSLNICEADGIHLRVLKELADVITRSVLIYDQLGNPERSWITANMLTIKSWVNVNGFTYNKILSFCS